MRSVREPIVRLIAPLALLGLLATGCGDDEESLSEDEFVEQANAICEEGSDDLDQASDEMFGSEEPTAEEIADFADVFEEAIGGQIDDLEDLDGPDDLEEELDPILDDARDTLSEFADEVRDDPEAAFTSDEDPFADINERLSALGLTSCAE
jgi:hypothetical protein